jgi:endonuclease YncB( thermonuclease family)
MHRRTRDEAAHRDVVDLSDRRLRGRGRVRAVRPRRRRGGNPWATVGLVCLLALAAVGGREGYLPVDLRHWLSVLGSGQPIRAAIAVSPRAPGASADCRVLRVVDGDTVELDCAGEGFLRARLLGFDTPEVFSPGCASELALGNAATRALERRIAASAEMRVELRGSDHHGRRLARLALDGEDVARPMIADGLARPYHGGRRRSWCG